MCVMNAGSGVVTRQSCGGAAGAIFLEQATVSAVFPNQRLLRVS